MECTEGSRGVEAIAKSRVLPSWCVAWAGTIAEKSNSEIRVEKEEVSEQRGKFILILKSPASMTGRCTVFVR